MVIEVFIPTAGGDERLGRVTARRARVLDVTDRAMIADEVCDYNVQVDGVPIGTVSHRYGDGWARLAILALGLVDGMAP